jgi:hypothetical protein
VVFLLPPNSFSALGPRSLLLRLSPVHNRPLFSLSFSLPSLIALFPFSHTIFPFLFLFLRYPISSFFPYRLFDSLTPTLLRDYLDPFRSTLKDPGSSSNLNASHTLDLPIFHRLEYLRHCHVLFFTLGLFLRTPPLGPLVSTSPCLFQRVHLLLRITRKVTRTPEDLICDLHSDSWATPLSRNQHFVFA